MKIAIASTRKDFSGEISSQGGRAPYYLIVDDQGKLLESISNPFARGGGGAGPSIAKILADKEVTQVVAGNLGDKMKEALSTRQLKYEIADGLIKNYLN